MQNNKDKKGRKPWLQNVRVDSVTALSEDGEQYTAKKTIYILQPEDQTFTMTFSEFVVFINSTDSLVDVKVFNWISNNLPYNGEEIILNKHQKKKIAEYTGFSYSAVEKSIGSLTSKKILVRADSCIRCAVYNVNPSYVWYGDSTSRLKRLDIVLKKAQYQDMDEHDRKIADDISRYEEYCAAQAKQSKEEFHKSHRSKEQPRQPKRPFSGFSSAKEKADMESGVLGNKKETV